LATGESTLLEVANGFVRSPQFQQIYSDDITNGAFVTLLYNNTFDGGPDDQGFARWTGELAAGASRAEVVLGVSQSPEFQTNTAADLKTWMRDLGVHDRIDAGAGDNLVAGGEYADVFVFEAGVAQTTTVADLEVWDMIDLIGFDYASDDAARAQMTQVGANVVFEDQGVEVIFQNATLAFFDDAMIMGSFA
jgi:hypothetical protein